MYQGKKILGIIPARGGSKGLPGKNIKPLLGRPLVGWTIDSCAKSKHLDQFVLSSDDLEIMEVAKSMGCEVPFRRPSELAQDDTPGAAPVLHALEELPGFDYVALLQPTSPLRSAEDIDRAIEKAIDNKVSSCVSVTPAKPAKWYVALDESDKIMVDPRAIDKTRQSAEENYMFNGAIYVVSVEALKATQSFLQEDSLAFVMPFEKSVDIDTPLDFAMCEFFASKLLK